MVPCGRSILCTCLPSSPSGARHRRHSAGGIGGLLPACKSALCTPTSCRLGCLSCPHRTISARFGSPSAGQLDRGLEAFLRAHHLHNVDQSSENNGHGCGPGRLQEQRPLPIPHGGEAGPVRHFVRWQRFPSAHTFECIPPPPFPTLLDPLLHAGPA